MFESPHSAFITLALAAFIASSVLYGLQALRLVAAGRLLKDPAIADHVGFALATFAYCAGCVVVTLHASQRFTMRFAHLNWTSGALIYFFYVRSLRSFTGTTLRSLVVCERIFGLAAVLFVADLLLLLATDTSVLFVPEPFATTNILFAHMGGNLYSATPFMGLLMLGVVGAAAWTYGSFIVAYLRSRAFDGWLLFGAALSLAGLGNELAIVLVPASPATEAYLAYTMSLLWLTNLPELARITWHYHRSTESLVEELGRAAALSSIAGSMAHDVGNPLAVIQLRLDGLQQDVSIPPAQRGALEQIGRNSLRIRDIMSGYLRLTGATTSARREVVTCRELLAEALALAEPRLRESGSPKVEVEEAPGAVVECQRTLVELALTNLLTNAAEAVKDVPDARISARIEVTNDEVHIHVTDTGPGFGTPFEQVVSGRSATPRAGGHGIGLRTAKRILESQGGRLELERASPTTLRVTLPRAR